jgi:hypothetical protein
MKRLGSVRSRVVRLGARTSVAVGAVAAALGCASVLGIGDLAVAPQDDASGAEGGGGDVRDERTTTCSPGAVVSPLSVFDPITVGGSPACRVQNAFDTDGVGAGLDYDDPQNIVALGGTTVTSCVAAQFGAALAKATVRMRAIGKACNTACSGVCGTGDNALLFAGPDVPGLHAVGDLLDITDTFADYPVAMQNADRIVVVCRSTQGTGRDDVEVDSILGTCP